MAVVSRPPAGQQSQHRKAFQLQQGRGRSTSGVLYGSSDNVDTGGGGGGGSVDSFHHKEWNSQAHGSGRSGGGGGGMSRSGRNIEQTNVVYQGDDFGGGFGSWCGCISRSGVVSPPPRGEGERAGRGRKGEKGIGDVKSGDMGSLVKSFSGSFERTGSTPGSSPAFRPRLSPGKVSPLVEVVPPPASITAAPVSQHLQAMASTVFSMSNYNLTPGVKMHDSSSGVSSSPPVDKIKASPTLFEMMTHEQELGPKAVHSISLSQQLTFQEKMKSILSGTSPGNQFNDTTTSDLKLSLNNREGCSVTVNVHRHILVTHSRFFAAKLSDRWLKQQRANPNLIEITDIDDVEIYLETLRLMYCEDVKKSLLKENVNRVLGILKLSAHIMFEGGVFACLEYLEAVPWADDEEEKVTALMGQLQLESVGVASDVMKRCSSLESTNNEDILPRLLCAVTKGTDDKARREMKSLVSRMLRENMSQNKNTVDISKESLYRACHGCLDSLLHLFTQSKSGEDRNMLVEISRQADNLHWLVDILVDRRIADDFVRMWAHQGELATLHAQVPVMFRYEVSRLTARLCIAIGKGQVLSPKDVRFLLLQTWLQPLVDDFAWMQRCCRNLDKKVVEEGISQTILTLPLKQQQCILLSWFDRFSSSGDDCPNLQKAFEVWWRRTFTPPCVEEDACAERREFCERSREEGHLGFLKS
ncbi:BTB/POZ domain-containing protein At1g63850 isoform X2 [Physcomitrium patens]|uniref:BTB domain-containing protein n=1 Tax=Physcomitrium patens TaxID=3218 RepID=A0A2K1JL64_PHYPA|nr:BTB/POZ domain-containing protein At1g63850-like [Physcomitrium patens]PNR42267.1 hypothetical protein PHYPA_017096 [Physcomitrium patens]|eukprot:XP_024391866.1 BTB/POZ domain-containing protein At1g63850-like [Physcomitrella patens]